MLPRADRSPGEYPLEPLPSGWVNVNVEFRHTDGKITRRIEILNTRNQNRYLQEPMAMISFKCFGLFVSIVPVYFLLYTTYHLIRLPVVTVLNLSPMAFFNQIWKIARIPIYFFALELAALYGVFCPLEGRAWFGYLESQLHNGKTRREAEQYQKRQIPPLQLGWESLLAVESRTSLFVAFCMQSIGNTADPHLLKVEVLSNPQ
jgi:hypothetical protein